MRLSSLEVAFSSAILRFSFASATGRSAKEKALLRKPFPDRFLVGVLGVFPWNEPNADLIPDVFLVGVLGASPRNEPKADFIVLLRLFRSRIVAIISASWDKNLNAFSMVGRVGMESAQQLLIKLRRILGQRRGRVGRKCAKQTELK